MHEDHGELVEGHNVETGKHSVKKGTEVDAWGKFGKPLFVAKAGPHGHVETAKHQVKKGVWDDFRTTELHSAARRGNVDFVRRLVEQGAQLNAKDERGETALYKAAWRGHVDVVKYLVESGANVNATDKFGDTALHDAAWAGHLDIVKYLVKNGAEVNATDGCGKAALHMAVRRGRVDVVKSLVENGAEVNATDERGETALYKAAWAGHVDVVKYLFENGADVNATDKRGETALHIAAKEGYVDIVKYLVENGVEVNATDKFDKTALHLAAKDGRVDVVKWLVEKGAQLDAKDEGGRTPLDLATERRRDRVVKYLEDVSAKRDMKIKEARSLAVQFTHENPCCIRVIPYENDDTKSLTICLYVDTGGNGIPDDVNNAAEEMFSDCEIQCVDLQRRPLSKIVARLPLCRRQKGEELLHLSKKIEKNLDVFENRLNVTAICASYKVRNSVEEEIPCVTVFVLGKGRIPAKETDIQKIKEDNGHLFDNAEFDVVEGYYRPAHGPTISSEMKYAGILRGGVGIGVKGVHGAGTLGGFLQDENRECYILSNDHVLNPLKSKDNALSSGDVEHGAESSTELLEGDTPNQIIEQPAQRDYKDIFEDAEKHLEETLEDIDINYPQIAELTPEEKVELKNNSEYFKTAIENYENEIWKAQQDFKKAEDSKPRQIGVYVDGLKDNVEMTYDNEMYKFYVDVAIAKLDKKEEDLMSRKKGRSKTNQCRVYGFEKINYVVPTGETLALETFVKEIREQNPELEPEEQLTFLKIGRTTGRTYEGVIDISLGLHVNNVSLPKSCAPALAHTPYWYCKNCKPSDISETALDEMESDGTQECATCKKKLEKREVYSFWKHNCFVLRQRGKPFSDDGDSGSLIFDNRGRAWGLVHGKFDDNNVFLTVASPLSACLKALEDKCGKKLKLWCVDETKEQAVIPAENETKDQAVRPAENKTKNQAVRPAENETKNQAVRPAENETKNQAVRPAENETKNQAVRPAENETKDQAVKPAENETKNQAVKPAENETKNQAVRPAENETKDQAVRPAENETKDQAVKTCGE